MLKKYLTLILTVVILSLAAFWVWLQADPPFHVYSSKIIKPVVEFKYPKTWKIHSEKGKVQNYTQVLVVGPRNKASDYNAMFTVRVSPVGDRFKEADELLQFKKDHMYQTAQVMDQSDLMLGAERGKSVMLAHTIPASGEHGMNTSPIDVKTQLIVVRHGGEFYEVIYKADKADFELYRKDFDQLTRSFKFN